MAGLLDTADTLALTGVEEAWRLIAGGMLVRTMRWDDMPRGSSADWTGRQERIVRAYWKWLELCKAQRVDPAPALMLAVEDKTLTVIDRELRRRKGYGASQLRTALDIYADVAGLRAPSRDWLPIVAHRAFEETTCTGGR